MTRPAGHEPLLAAPGSRAAARRARVIDTAFAAPGTDSASRSGVLLSLQRSAGNAAVSRALTGAPAAARKPRKPATPNSYVDLLNGIQDLVEAADNHGTGLAELKFGTRLGDEHREWLESLRRSLVLAFGGKAGSAQEALAAWESLQSRIWAAIDRAHKLGVPTADVTHVRQMMSHAHDDVLRPAAYWDAHREAVAHGDRSPGLAIQQKNLEEAESDFEGAQQLVEEASKMAGQGITAMFLKDAGLGKDIVELVRLPGSIEEKLAWAKKNGVLAQTATGAELVNKIAGAAKTTAVIGCEIGKRFAEAQHELAVAKNAVHMAEHWEKVVQRWGGKLRFLDNAGRVIGVVGVVADALKMVRAIARGDWAEAANEGGALVVDIAGLGLAEGAPLLGAITIVIKAEIAALQSAAVFIRWCREENVREAAGHFVEAAQLVAKNGALDFTADVDVLLDPSNQNISDIVGKQLVAHTAAMRQGLAYMARDLDLRGPSRLGGQPALRAMLGAKAERALTGDIGMPDDPLTTAQRVQDVFEGTNAMAKWVSENFPTGEEQHGPGHGKTEEAGAKEHAHAE
jgi:hypothetical protein